MAPAMAPMAAPVAAPEVDDEEVMTVLRITEHGGEEDGAWVLLEPTEPVVAAVEPVVAAV